MIEQNVKELLAALEKGNAFGEKVTLVAATKTRTAEEINRAIKAGITDIGENKVQEFRDKYDAVTGGNRHFIGHLQTNTSSAKPICITRLTATNSPKRSQSVRKRRESFPIFSCRSISATKRARAAIPYPAPFKRTKG